MFSVITIVLVILSSWNLVWVSFWGVTNKKKMIRRLKNKPVLRYWRFQNDHYYQLFENNIKNSRKRALWKVSKVKLFLIPVSCQATFYVLPEIQKKKPICSYRQKWPNMYYSFIYTWLYFMVFISGVILETGQCPKDTKKALFHYRKLKRAPLIWPPPIFMASLQLFW